MEINQYGLHKQSMKAVLQRVHSANVIIENTIFSSIKSGILILLGIEEHDTSKDLEYVVNKSINLRIFKDEHNNMNLSIKDIQGEMLIVSQFTLCANTKKGRRPSFLNAAEPKIAKYIYEQFCEMIKKNNIPVQQGKFGAAMNINLINDGPVTLIIDSRDKNS